MVPLGFPSFSTLQSPGWAVSRVTVVRYMRMRLFKVLSNVPGGAGAALTASRSWCSAPEGLWWRLSPRVQVHLRTDEELNVRERELRPRLLRRWGGGGLSALSVSTR